MAVFDKLSFIPSGSSALVNDEGATSIEVSSFNYEYSSFYYRNDNNTPQSPTPQVYLEVNIPPTTDTSLPNPNIGWCSVVVEAAIVGNNKVSSTNVSNRKTYNLKHTLLLQGFPLPGSTNFIYKSIVDLTTPSSNYDIVLTNGFSVDYDYTTGLAEFKFIPIAYREVIIKGTYLLM